MGNCKKSIDFYIEHTGEMKELNFHFYGGEPFLNFELIKASVLYVNSKRLNKKCKFFVTTNMTILNKDIIEFLYQNQFLVLVSLDGPEKIHNRNRKGKMGRDSYQTVITNLKYIKKYYYKFYQTITLMQFWWNRRTIIGLKIIFSRTICFVVEV